MSDQTTVDVVLSSESTVGNPIVETVTVIGTVPIGPRGIDGVGGGGGAPDDATYLVTAAHADLSAEVVVGATPGGELGGTWASPTVDATHSGSSHAAVQAAAEATAAAALSAHDSDTTAVHGITNTAALETTAGAQAKVNAHEADTTNVHGIADTSALLDTGDIGATVQAHSAVLDATTAAFTTADETKVDHLTVTQAVDLDAIETRVNSLDAAVVLRGTWDASAGTFPGGGTAQAGDSYIVTVAGTVNAVAFAVGDRIIAIVDNASTSTFAANWFKADYTDQVLSVDGRTGAVTLGDLYQPLDSDLTAIAGLTPTNDDIVQRKAGAWTNRTLAQLIADLAALGTTFQPLDGDLTAIAALATTTFGRSLLTLADAAALLAAAGAQASSADLTDLVARWVAASASGPASLAFAEDTDNGSNTSTITAPASLGGDRTLTLPDASGTLLTTAAADAAYVSLAAQSNYARIEKASTQSVTATTTVDVTFGTEILDGNGLWVVGSPDRLTIQRAGVYDIVFGLSWAANSVNDRVGYVFKNGTGGSGTLLGMAGVDAAVVEATRFQVVVPLISLAVNDYIACRAYNGSSGTVDLVSGNLTFLSAALRYPL